MQSCCACCAAVLARRSTGSNSKRCCCEGVATNVDLLSSSLVWFSFLTCTAVWVQSVVDLGGRFFGGRTVSATFFDEDRFDKQDLGPKAGEFG